jgi:hypothetical protein
MKSQKLLTPVSQDTEHNEKPPYMYDPATDKGVRCYLTEYKMSMETLRQAICLVAQPLSNRTDRALIKRIIVQQEPVRTRPYSIVCRVLLEIVTIL